MSITSHWERILEIFALAGIKPVSQGIWHPRTIFPRDYGIPLGNFAPPEVAGNMASLSLALALREFGSGMPYPLGNIAGGCQKLGS